LSEPPACSVFDPRPDAPESIVLRSPATLFSARGVNAKHAFSLTSCRSRKLGTAFRSPVTTLSPPLRGQCSRPAPSIPRRRFFANPFHRKLLRSVRFSKTETGRIHRFRPVVRAALRRSRDVIRSPLPFRFFNLPDQSVQPAPSQEARLARRWLFQLPGASLSMSPRCLKPRFVLPGKL
jgi:hypothetical protein